MLVFVYVVSAFGLYQFANDLYVSGVKCGIYVQQMVDMGTENTQPETEM